MNLLSPPNFEILFFRNPIPFILPTIDFEEGALIYFFLFLINFKLY